MAGWFVKFSGTGPEGPNIMPPSCSSPTGVIVVSTAEYISPHKEHRLKGLLLVQVKFSQPLELCFLRAAMI